MLDYAIINYFAIRIGSALLTVSLQGTIILALALGLLAKVKLSPGRKHAFIVLSMISFLIISLFAVLQPAIRESIRQYQPFASTQIGTSFQKNLSAPNYAKSDEIDWGEEDTASAACPEPCNPSKSLHWAFWGLLLWACGVSIGLIYMLIGEFGLSRLLRRAKRCQHPLYAEVIQKLLRQSGVKRKVLVVESTEVSVPVTCGIFRPYIVLPASGLWQNSIEEVEMAIFHELIHIKRWDCFTQFLSRLVCLVFWFNPLIWRAFFQQRITQESACDARVISSGVQPADYAEMLVHVVRRLNPRPVFAGTSLSLAKPSVLEQRIVAIFALREEKRRIWVRKLIMLTGVLGLCVMAMFTSGISLYNEASNLKMLKTALRQQQLERPYEDFPALLKLQQKGMPVAWPVLYGKGFHDQNNSTWDMKSVCWIDIYWHDSLPVVAPEDGVVVDVGYVNGDLFIKLAHPFHYSTLYMNIERHAVIVGQEVKKGQVIGHMRQWFGRDQYTHKLRYSILHDDQFVDTYEILYRWGPRFYFGKNQTTG